MTPSRTPSSQTPFPPTSPPPGSGDGVNPFGWRFVTPLYVGSALNPINSSLIATALVPIAAGIHVSVGQTAILVSCLYLASAIAQPTGGKLGEVFGPRRVFLAGILLVLAGGILGGLSHTLGELTVARILIGIGTSGGYPSAMLIVRRRAQDAGLSAPPGGVLGGLQIAGTATAALGLPIGGVIVDAFGWRSTFLINVPVTIIAFLVTLLWLPRDPLAERLGTRTVLSRIDLTGILLFAAALSGLMIFLDALPTPRWAYLAAAVVLAVALVLWERTVTTPFLDVRLLTRNLALTRTYLRFGLTSLCVYTVLYGLSDWLEVTRHYDSRTVGLLILPMSGLSAILMRPVASRNLIRSALYAAALASLAGSIGIMLLGTGTPIILVIALTLVFGVALGTFAPANQTALYQQADPDQIGTAAGLLRTFGYIGSVASSALISIFFRTSVTDAGLHTIGAVMTGASILGVLLLVADRQLRHRHAAS
ncbi:MFS transporter [Flexivirga caeni]|uniref:MFS transporter n=1 Tax=Flexivirga caeni TaxID=2294115 RepID=A0A3M9MGS8_9MICO|nr:MFS transporter [Flexivirga caeni]RNI24726.1 MFS transporter [Flexivirga caeni]